MPKLTDVADLLAITNFVQQAHGGVSLASISAAFPHIETRSLQRRLKRLVDDGQLTTSGAARAVRYLIPEVENAQARPTPQATPPTEEVQIPLSDESKKIQTYIRQPVGDRKPVGYNRSFLDAYRPNLSFYLSEHERAHLAKVGKTNIGVELAGTYAKTIMTRLLVDLSWNSSRLEGNTYSLLDTRRLIEFGKETGGHNRKEAQMILNHKDAIEFLIRAAEDSEFGFNRYIITNLHGILAQDLLPDPASPGRIRQIPVGIDGSVFHPLEIPQVIDECFNQVLATAEAIRDPFEQAFFAMVQLPYLQPFDDVNKRVSRLAANIPFIKGNLIPLSFVDVPRSIYTEAILSVYELNQVDLLRDVFIWTYERSAEHYAAVQQSIGDPDPFRQRHRAALHQLIAEVMRNAMGRAEADAYITTWINKKANNIPKFERKQFRELAESDLLGIHDGNFARFQIRPAEFRTWQAVWNSVRSDESSTV